MATATAFSAVLVAATATGAVGANAAGALGRVVSSNPANYTPNVRNGAVYKLAEYKGIMCAGGSFTSVAAAAGTRPAGTFARSRIVAFTAATGSIPSFALNIPRGRDSAGPGAVSRPGIGALDPRTGQAPAWNPGQDRGVGGKDLLVTARGLWVASDSTHIGHETHQRIALLPR